MSHQPVRARPPALSKSVAAMFGLKGAFGLRSDELKSLQTQAVVTAP
jgi:hypothetical protein